MTGVLEALKPPQTVTTLRAMLRLRPIARAAMIAVAVMASRGALALTDADRTDIARVEAYLEGIRSLRAGFVQVASNGSFSEGEFRLRRPGKLRLDYKPPPHIQVYADGIWLIYVDTRLQEVTHIPISSTPIGFLVRDKVRLSGDVSVTAVTRGPDTLTVHMVQTKEPDSGSLALTFSEKPLELRQWRVVDAQGIETRVTLIGAEANVAIADEVFAFDPRKFEIPRRE